MNREQELRGSFDVVVKICRKLDVEPLEFYAEN